MGEVLQVEGNPVLATQLRSNCGRHGCAARARSRAPAPVGRIRSRSAGPDCCGGRECGAQHGPRPGRPAGRREHPAGWGSAQGSGAGRGDSRRSHVVESEEVVAGEGAERCHDDGDYDAGAERDSDEYPGNARGPRSRSRRRKAADSAPAPTQPCPGRA